MPRPIPRASLTSSAEPALTRSSSITSTPGRRTTKQAEDQLRNRLRDFAVLTPDGARKEVALLEKDHGWRRGTVWADLDQAPLAFALEQLVTLAE